MYVLVMYLVKAAFCAIYFELSCHLSRQLRRGLYIVVAYVVISYLITFSSLMGWCGRTSRAW